MFMPKVAESRTEQPPASLIRRAGPRGSTFVWQRPGQVPAETAFGLQPKPGNRATPQLQRPAQLHLSARGSQHDQDATDLNRAVMAGTWDFSKIPIFPTGRLSQSKARSRLTVAAAPAEPSGVVADGPAELEANRLADHVLQMGERGAQNPGLGISRGKARSLSSDHSGLDGGRPLPGSVRSYFEPRFGCDFSSVRVHDDDRAARMSQSLRATAFTFGNDIYFDRHRFAPDGQASLHLLAHELAHVVQQASARAPRVQRQARGEVRPPSPAWKIPKTGWYKGTKNNTWGGLPEILYPDTPDDFMSLTVIDMNTDQMFRLQFDADTIRSQSTGERRLPSRPDPLRPEWASWFVQGRVSGRGVPTLAELEAEYKRLRDEVLHEIATMKKPELREFLTQPIRAWFPPSIGARSLHRAERMPRTELLHEERLITLLLRYPHGPPHGAEIPRNPHQR
jgi:hypothetical protein